jgi:hypothetical protein
MPFVFVSHASQDKPRIRHVVEALIADGHKIWLDNPGEMGYSANEIDLHFIRLHADRRWHDEIDEAVRGAGAVLVCFSKRFNETRDVWQDEAAGARILGKLIGCRIDDLDRSTLRNQFHLQQLPDVRHDRPESDLKTAIGLLVADVRRVLERTNRRAFEGRKLWRRDPDAPYLIDRTTHEEQIGDAIEQVDRLGGVRAFFLAGPENECVDEFIDRLEKRTGPERLKGRSWHKLVIDWPADRRGDDFVRTFLRRCAKQLRRPIDANEATIAQALSELDRPVAVLSLMAACEWRADEEQRIGDWLQAWHRLAQQPQRFSALPILCLKMAPAKPGWKGCPGGTAPGATMSNTAIWRAAWALQRKPDRWTAWFRGPQPDRAAIEIPPLLHPVTQGHADTWLAHTAISHQLGNDVSGARTRIRELFSGHPAIALETFAIGMKQLFHGEI